MFSNDVQISTTENLPEVRPYDGSGNDKYYVPPESATDGRRSRHPERANTTGNDSHLPERTYKDEDKQAYEITYPVGYLEQKHANANQPSPDQADTQKDKSHLRIRKVSLIWAGVALLVVIIVVVLGTVLGLRDRKNPDPSPTQSVDLQASVGGYLSEEYYSRLGAFNGTGITWTSSDAMYDPATFIFYQDYTGGIKYTLQNFDGGWTDQGYVNLQSGRALNGTPLSAVQRLNKDVVYWHVFYIDVDFFVREVVASNDTIIPNSMLWQPGLLNRQNLKALQAGRIGMTACSFNVPHGQSWYNDTGITSTIELFFAIDDTTMEAYFWANGSDSWHYARNFAGVDAHASSSCHTEPDMTQYIFFINNNQGVSFYWRDTNQSEVATSAHPINEWTLGELDISSVREASPLAVYSYLIYQSIDGSLRSINLHLNAENTTANRTYSWILKTQDEVVTAMAGTQLSLTTLSIPGGTAQAAAFFQQHGNDLTYYTRDIRMEGAPWIAPPEQPVVP